jgi:hypothetical protein
MRGVAAGIVALACLAAAPAARADTASISFLDASGRADAVADVGRVWAVSGNTTAAKRVYIRYRAPGGAPCAPSASSDAGDNGFTDFSGTGDQFNGAAVNGDFTLRKTGRWLRPGTFMFCIWLADSESAVTTPIRQDVTFRAATGAISGSVAPVNPKPGESATVTITGASEAPKRVYAEIRPAGGPPCAISATADSGRRLVDGTSVNGSFTLTATARESTPGEYLVCMWLADSEGDTAPVAGPQPASFTVQRPCIVPRVSGGSSLSAAQSALIGANCTMGAARYVASVRYRRGTVVRLSPRAGTSLDPQAAVRPVVSTGRPCVVPKAPRGVSLAAARRRLRAAGCTTGRVRYVRSARRAGTLVSFGPRSGKRLSSRATVVIRISRGR